jgi:ADP-ribose pyrophosphatase
MMEHLRTLRRRPLLTVGDGRFLSVESHTVVFPDGQIVEDWGWVITPDYINVVAVTLSGEFLCFRQPKYAVEGLTFGVTGGYIEAGEHPLAAAQRELLEETGYVAATWRSLGSYAVDGNRGAGRAHFFLATGACWQQPINADDLEEQELLLLNRSEVESTLLAGEFKVLPWAACVALALVALDAAPSQR